MKSGLPVWQDMLLRGKYAIRSLSGTEYQWFGLDTAVLIREIVPIFIAENRMDDIFLERVEHDLTAKKS